MIDTGKLIAGFCDIAGKAGVKVAEQTVTAEVLKNPHVPPSSLPNNKMAVYVFLWGDRCLKVGKVGPRSAARYTSQHYNPWSSKSNLAKSILKNKEDMGLSGISAKNVGAWIKRETTRINILIPSELGIPVLSLLESFLQCKLRPEFEGFESQRDYKKSARQVTRVLKPGKLQARHGRVSR